MGHGLHDLLILPQIIYQMYASDKYLPLILLGGKVEIFSCKMRESHKSTKRKEEECDRICLVFDIMVMMKVNDMLLLLGKEDEIFDHIKRGYQKTENNQVFILVVEEVPAPQDF